MKIKFNKDITIKVSDVEGNVFDKLFRVNSTYDVIDVNVISKHFSNIDIGSLSLIDVPNKSFDVYE